MPAVVLPTQAEAVALVAKLDALLGLPDPVRYPGTLTWAIPRELADGTWCVPVPRKGPLLELLGALDADPTGKALVAEQVDGVSGKVTKARRVKPAELTDVQAKLAAAREVRIDEEKPAADIKAAKV